MNNTTAYKAFFSLTSHVTDMFPGTGARALDFLARKAIGNRALLSFRLKKDRALLARIPEFRRILVVGDMNIGDAVMLQAAITALRDFFPEAAIDYCINRYARNLVEGNHEISRVWPLFTGAYATREADLAQLREIMSRNRYDLIVNFCPLFAARQFAGDRAAIEYPSLVARVIASFGDKNARAHIVSCAHRFIYDVFAGVRDPQRVRPFSGVTVTLADRAVQRAESFLEYHELAGRPLLFHNPDASSDFTRIPFAYQVQLLRRSLESGYSVLVGEGVSAKEIGRRLVQCMPPSLARRAVIVPSSMPLDAYAALVDRCTVFVTADTGPLHIAAARKTSYSGGYVFRNRTSIVSIFGATPSRIYGYDSYRPGYIAACQDAPAFSYTSSSRCRNITCVNKIAKTCRSVACFEHLDIDAIAGDLRQLLAAGAAGFSNRAHDTLAVRG